MAVLDVGQRRGARRNVIVDLEPIPMIDLMMVLISFLLITAVWSHMARTDASANAPASGDPTTTAVSQKVLHVEVRDDFFVLTWRQEKNALAHIEIARHAEEHLEGAVRIVRYPELAAGLKTAWETGGAHRDGSDPALDRAVLHTPDTLPYADLIAVLDAVHGVKRPMFNVSRGAFDVTFAVD